MSCAPPQGSDLSTGVGQAQPWVGPTSAVRASRTGEAAADGCAAPVACMACGAGCWAGRPMSRLAASMASRSCLCPWGCPGAAAPRAPTAAAAGCPGASAAAGLFSRSEAACRGLAAGPGCCCKRLAAEASSGSESELGSASELGAGALRRLCRLPSGSGARPGAEGPSQLLQSVLGGTTHRLAQAAAGCR